MRRADRPPTDAASAVRPGRGWSRALHALAIAARTASAVLGGYLLAHGFAAFMTLALPFARADRVIAANLMAILVACLGALYAFAARSAWRACLLPAAAGTLLLGIAALFPEHAARP